MWLPKDERRLIEGYYINIGEAEKEEWYGMSNWIPVIRTLRVKDRAQEVKSYLKGGKSQSEHDKLDPKDRGGSMKKWLKYRNRINIANTSLKARKLIELRNHQSESDVKAISLTIQGYDLGKKYSSIPHTILLWCNEYKVWIILGLIISFVSVLVKILKD